jgi:ribose transport system permease protein
MFARQFSLHRGEILGVSGLMSTRCADLRETLFGLHLGFGLVLLNVSPFWHQVVKGLVILLALVIEKLNSRGE